MKALAMVLTVIAGIFMWACGIGVAVSTIAAVLKLIGVSALAGMSYWLPLKFAGGWVIGFLVTAVSAAIALGK